MVHTNQLLRHRWMNRRNWKRLVPKKQTEVAVSERAERSRQMIDPRSKRAIILPLRFREITRLIYIRYPRCTAI